MRYLQVYVTFPDKKTANKLIRVLINERLGACGQLIGPITSTYWWQGKVKTAEEWLCLIKTNARIYPQVEKVIKANHPYETPEIIAVPIAAGARGYIRWLEEELRPPALSEG